MGTILHLSLPAADLAETRRFYVDVLGCAPGRQRPGWFDVWFHGLQLTFHEEPDQVTPPERAGARHFGVTLPMAELDPLLARLDAAGVRWVRTARTDEPGTPREQRKAKLADPSGNVIELKSYADPVAALEIPEGAGVADGGAVS
jgi:extradiol dioxygenase family protein